MEGKTVKARKTRAFIALDIPAATRAELGAWGRAEITDPALRPVAPDSLHVTLAFLAWLEPDALERAAAVVAAFVPTPVELRFEPEPVSLPRRGRGVRLYALGVVSPQAIAAQARVEEALVAAGVYEPEDRPFWPHVTAARVRRRKEGRRGHMSVERPPGALPEGLLRPFDSVRITLYRSQTKSAGAEYTPLAQVELPGPPAAGQR
jgi:2'-5' RNA ligase